MSYSIPCWICNASLGNKSDTSDCSNSACIQHGRGDDSVDESTDSEMDIKDNLVQDAQGGWHIAVTETHEQATINKLERMYHLKLKLFQTSVKAAMAEIEGDTATAPTAEAAEASTSRPSVTRVNPDSQFPVIIRWQHGGYLTQNAPEDQPHLDSRSLDKDDTVEMTKRQIKNWLAYRKGVEQEINDTNRIELKQVAEDLRNRMFEIIKHVLPDSVKEKKL